MCTHFETAVHKFRINRPLSFVGVETNILIVLVIFIVIVLGGNGP